MKPTDVVILVRFVAELQPAQRFTDYTPDAWAMVLADVPADLETAKDAVVRLAKRATWFTPGEVRNEIRKSLPPSALAAPAAGRRELDWSRDATSARREAAARAKAAAAEEIARRGFKYSRRAKDSAVATNPKLAAALEQHRAEQQAPKNPAGGMSLGDAVSEFKSIPLSRSRKE